jgi:hypothetical protein
MTQRVAAWGPLRPALATARFVLDWEVEQAYERALYPNGRKPKGGR